MGGLAPGFGHPERQDLGMAVFIGRMQSDVRGGGVSGDLRTPRRGDGHWKKCERYYCLDASGRVTALTTNPVRPGKFNTLPGDLHLMVIHVDWRHRGLRCIPQDYTWSSARCLSVDAFAARQFWRCHYLPRLSPPFRALGGIGGIPKICCPWSTPVCSSPRVGKGVC